MHIVAEEVGKICRTSQYNKFRIDTRNRPVDDKHVGKIMRSIQRTNLLESRPILVTKDYKVVDGQHRLTAAKRLNLPIYYMVVDMDIEEAPTINSSQKNWDSEDYLYSYAEQGKESYLRLLEISRETRVPSNLLMKIVSSKTNKGKTYQEFRIGKFELDVNQVYNLKKHLIAVRTIIERLKSHPAHSEKAKYIATTRGIEGLYLFLQNVLPMEQHELFIKKMYDLASRLYKCSTITEYKDMYMSIYKYHNARSVI